MNLLLFDCSPSFISSPETVLKAVAQAVMIISFDFLPHLIVSMENIEHQHENYKIKAILRPVIPLVPFFYFLQLVLR